MSFAIKEEAFPGATGSWWPRTINYFCNKAMDFIL